MEKIHHMLSLNQNYAQIKIYSDKKRKPVTVLLSIAQIWILQADAHRKGVKKQPETITLLLPWDWWLLVTDTKNWLPYLQFTFTIDDVLRAGTIQSNSNGFRISIFFGHRHLKHCIYAQKSHLSVSLDSWNSQYTWRGTMYKLTISHSSIPSMCG